jgi:hypothetical protein
LKQEVWNAWFRKGCGIWKTAYGQTWRCRLAHGFRAYSGRDAQASTFSPFQDRADRARALWDLTISA